MIQHPDPISERCPSGQRARGIDRNDRDGSPKGAETTDKFIDQRAFSSAGWSGYTDRACVSGARVEAFQGDRCERVIVLDVGGKASDGADIAAECVIDEPHLKQRRGERARVRG